jgi:hypothetical protein
MYGMTQKKKFHPHKGYVLYIFLNIQPYFLQLGCHKRSDPKGTCGSFDGNMRW